MKLILVYVLKYNLVCKKTFIWMKFTEVFLSGWQNPKLFVEMGNNWILKSFMVDSELLFLAL